MTQGWTGLWSLDSVWRWLLHAHRRVCRNQCCSYTSYQLRPSPAFICANHAGTSVGWLLLLNLVRGVGAELAGGLRLCHVMSYRKSSFWSESGRIWVFPPTKGSITQFTLMKQQFPQGEYPSMEEMTHFVLTPLLRSWPDYLRGCPTWSILQSPYLQGADVYANPE